MTQQLDARSRSSAGLAEEFPTPLCTEAWSDKKRQAWWDPNAGGVSELAVRRSPLEALLTKF
jgi:hypothetical protein